ncbi:reverse transcriptase domain-containing protein [Nephila pilipes]|uniref:Reverse transcriptase domain-containing protein n=1 Tax=Nephila pilipes TaxID=299642 RepID=A0A8X6UMK9_NEPPI|nr:reverse transcriptase domain-containing protein [Nephila pilipes]
MWGSYTDGGQEAYKYLSVRVGLNYRQDNSEFFQEITRDVKLVAASPLAPWQKLTAIRAHILSRAEFLCRNSHIQKRDVADLDKTLIPTGKRILNLPTRANVNLVHLSCNKGGAALPHFRALLDVYSISHAFRLLASDDHLTSDVAFAGLQSAVRKKILRDPTPSECAELLNGNKAGDFARESGDLSTQWSRARQAADHLSKYIKFSWIFNEELGCFHLNIYRSPNPVCVVPSTAGLVARLLRDDLESHYIRQLSGLVDQGKTVEVFSQHPASNHFLQAGDFTRFCDWNFIHRARLGCLQLNATMRFIKRNPKCRKCGYVRETIPHVLNHCKPHSDAWKRRHDAILNRVARAIPSSIGSVSINKKFPGIAQTLIPDMVLTKKSGEVFVIDFTVAFEDRLKSFATARKGKIDKYLPIVEHLRREGKVAHVDAMVVGSLGSWDPSNDAALAQMGVSRKYAKLMRKLICSDTIRWSRDIYIQHLTDKKQY